MEENSGWWLDQEYITPSHTHPTSRTIPPHLCPESRSSPALSLQGLLEEMVRDGWLTSGSPPPGVTPLSRGGGPQLVAAASDHDLALIILLTSTPSPDIALTAWSRHEVRTSHTLLPQTDRQRSLLRE